MTTRRESSRLPPPRRDQLARPARRGADHRRRLRAAVEGRAEAVGGVAGEQVRARVRLGVDIGEDASLGLARIDPHHGEHLAVGDRPRLAVLVVLHLEAHDRGVGLEALLALDAAPLDGLAGAPGADDIVGAARRREAVAERKPRVAVARLDLGAAVARTALDLVRLWRAAAGHKPAAPADKLGVA